MPAACRIPGRPLFSPLRPATLAPKGPLARIARRYLSFPLCPLPNPYIVLRFLCRRENGQKPSGKRTGTREIRERPQNSGRGGDFPPRPFLLPNRLFSLPSRRNRRLRYETLGRSHPSRRLRQKRRIEEQYVDLSPRIVVPESVSDDVIAIPRLIEGNPVRTPGTVQTVTISDVHSRSKRLEGNVRSSSRYRSASGEFDAAVRKVGPDGIVGHHGTGRTVHQAGNQIGFADHFLAHRNGLPIGAVRLAASV